MRPFQLVKENTERIVTEENEQNSQPQIIEILESKDNIS